MENWERQVARILGVPTTDIMENYYGKNQANALQVNEEQLLTFYDYLRDELAFPFAATYQTNGVSTQTSAITCIKLEPEIQVDVSYGIRIECEKEGEKLILPLTAIIADKKDTNYSTIQLYQTWVQKYK